MYNSNVSGDFYPISIYYNIVPKETCGLDHEAMKIGTVSGKNCEHCYCQPGLTIGGVKHMECCKCEDRKAIYPIITWSL
jgi:hypothetical protein